MISRICSARKRIVSNGLGKGGGGRGEVHEAVVKDRSKGTWTKKTEKRCRLLPTVLTLVRSTSKPSVYDYSEYSTTIFRVAMPFRARVIRVGPEWVIRTPPTMVRNTLGIVLLLFESNTYARTTGFSEHRRHFAR